MELIIKREYKQVATFGDGAVIDSGNLEPVFEFAVLEPTKRNCIPEGTYLVLKIRKENHSYFQIQDADGRDYTAIKSGNYQDEFLSPILVGEEIYQMNSHGTVDVTHQRASLKVLVALLPAKFKLTITSIQTVEGSGGSKLEDN